MLLQKLSTGLHKHAGTSPKASAYGSKAIYHIENALLDVGRAFFEVLNDGSQKVIHNSFHLPKVVKFKEEVGEAGEGLTDNAGRVVVKEFQYLRNNGFKVLLLNDWL